MVGTLCTSNDAMMDFKKVSTVELIERFVSCLVQGIDDDGVVFGALKVGPVDWPDEEGILEQ